MLAWAMQVMTIAPRYDQYSDAWDTSTTINVLGEEIRFFHSNKSGVDRVFVDHPMFLAKVRRHPVLVETLTVAPTGGLVQSADATAVPAGLVCLLQMLLQYRSAAYTLCHVAGQLASGHHCVTLHFELCMLWRLRCPH